MTLWCGRRDVGTDDHVTITSLPKFIGLLGYQICLAMVLRWRATRAVSTLTYTYMKDVYERHPKLVNNEFTKLRLQCHVKRLLDNKLYWFRILFDVFFV